MRNSSIALCLAAVLPCGVVSTALAQPAPPVPSSEQADGSSPYSLKNTALQPPVLTPQQAASAPYELSGTNISGATQTTEVILTAPIDKKAVAYKTESGVYLYPTVFMGFGYNDNVRASSTDPIGSSLINVVPEVVAEMKHKGDRYTAKAALNITRYANSSDDNYSNPSFELAGDNYFSARARTGWSVGQVNGIDPRGATSRTASSEPDHWHSNNVNGRAIYGAPEAPGRLELDLGSQAKTYDNNRAFTAVSDVTVNSLAARAFYRLGTRTMALVEFRDAKADYPSSLSTDSNTERRYYGGLTWEATAATTGIVKVGYMTKDFDLASKSSYSGGSWEATVRWLPQTYSAFDLTTSRSAVDSTGFGDYTVNTSLNLLWNHQWSQSLTSRASVGVLATDFAGTNRKDTTNSLALTVYYAV